MFWFPAEKETEATGWSCRSGVFPLRGRGLRWVAVFSSTLWLQGFVEALALAVLTLACEIENLVSTVVVGNGKTRA